jgi:hypothetical protein
MIAMGVWERCAGTEARFDVWGSTAAVQSTLSVSCRCPSLAAALSRRIATAGLPSGTRTLARPLYSWVNMAHGECANGQRSWAAHCHACGATDPPDQVAGSVQGWRRRAVQLSAKDGVIRSYRYLVWRGSAWGATAVAHNAAAYPCCGVCANLMSTASASPP